MRLHEISDQRLQDYLHRAGRRVDSRLERIAQARQRLSKGYEIYHADRPANGSAIVDRFEADTPALARQYYEQFIHDYESDVDFDLRLRRATGIMEYKEPKSKRARRGGIDLEAWKDGLEFQINATTHDRDLGRVVFDVQYQGNQPVLVAKDLMILPEYRGQGIAAIMYDYAKELGYQVERSSEQTDAGKQFWDKNRGEAGQVWEDKTLDPDVYGEMLPTSTVKRIVAGVMNRVDPGAKVTVKESPEGYYIVRGEKLRLDFGITADGGDINANIVNAYSSYPGAGVVTNIFAQCFKAAEQLWGKPNRFAMSAHEDRGHGVWQHIAQKLGAEWEGSITENTAPTPAQTWIEQVYSQYMDWPYGQADKVMVWGQGEEQQFAAFKLKPGSSPNTVEIDWIMAGPEQRKGVGSRAIKELQRQAQADGIRLTLYPWAKGQISQASLTKLYKRHGFKSVAKGAKPMVWEPVNEIARLPKSDAGDFGDKGTIVPPKHAVNKKPLPGGAGFTYAVSKTGSGDIEIMIFDGDTIAAELDLFETQDVTGAWRVETVVVDPDYRGRGLGKALYGIALSILRLTIEAGDTQTRHGQQMWLMLNSIPGVEVVGYNMDPTDKYQPQRGDKIIKQDADWTRYTFPVKPGSSSMRSGRRGTGIYTSQASMIAKWTGK